MLRHFCYVYPPVDHKQVEYSRERGVKLEFWDKNSWKLLHHITCQLIADSNSIYPTNIRITKQYQTLQQSSTLKNCKVQMRDKRKEWERERRERERLKWGAKRCLKYIYVCRFLRTSSSPNCYLFSTCAINNICSMLLCVLSMSHQTTQLEYWSVCFWNN